MIHIVFAAVSALAGATGTYVFLDARHERELSDLRAAQATALAKATSDALAETQRLQKAKDEAEKRAAKRLADARADAARSAAALGMLGEAADTAIRAANDSHSACVATVATSTDLLQQCSSRYRDMAAEADQWVSESVMLRDAWPR